ncbi:MAG: cell wall-binding repeat-containing protein [Desulfosporosinus sp.]|nr:cell wall-binding repeat-containing protein [Desulfosporosinus sp.]
MTLTMAPFNVIADGVTTARLFGSDRIGTAVAVADAGWTTADTAILAPSADVSLVDALAAAPLAGKTAPILLTDNNTLTDATKIELVKLGVKNVYLVGAINQTVVDQINAMVGVTATVLKGTDRIGTAVAISSKLTDPAGSFVVGYGAWADALSVASYAAANNYSILIANSDGTLPASETAYQGTKVYILGGPTLVSDIPGATRLFGEDRFATNQAVLNALTYKYDKIYVANGTDAHLVDSLVASSLAAKSGSPIILGDTNSVAGAVSVHGKLAANAIVTALGGITVVLNADVEQVASETPMLSLPSGIASTLPDGTVGAAYTFKISATGGTPPYRYVASNYGASGLPVGLTLGADGTISGTNMSTLPPGFGGVTYMFTVSVTDSATPTAGTVSQNFNITVFAANNK